MQTSAPPQHPQQFQHLNNAPIVEAIIDFRVRLPADFDVTRLGKAHDRVRDSYPAMDEHRFLRQEIKANPGQQPTVTVHDEGIGGYFFRSLDQKNLAQFRKDGFTFNRLHPYTSWEHIFPEASRLWELYVEVAQPEEISRIAVRYINRLPFPALDLDLSKYLTAEPRLPTNLPQNFSGFLTRVVTYDPATKIEAAILQALENPVNQQYLSIILDIDVYTANTSELRFETVLAKFAQLREMKNRIFFGSLTEQAIALFR